jgi:hypothetical protein
MTRREFYLVGAAKSRVYLDPSCLAESGFYYGFFLNSESSFARVLSIGDVTLGAPALLGVK